MRDVLLGPTRAAPPGTRRGRADVRADLPRQAGGPGAIWGRGAEKGRQEVAFAADLFAWVWTAGRAWWGRTWRLQLPRAVSADGVWLAQHTLHEGKHHLRERTQPAFQRPPSPNSQSGLAAAVLQSVEGMSDDLALPDEGGSTVATMPSVNPARESIEQFVACRLIASEHVRDRTSKS